jgi:hypothetical protein
MEYLAGKTLGKPLLKKVFRTVPKRTTQLKISRKAIEVPQTKK